MTHGQSGSGQEKPKKEMLSNFEDMARLINPHKRVRVYKNLHKDCWSVWQGRVLFYTQEIHLRDVVFLVLESGRQRVLKEKRKNVHAFVCGFLTQGLDIGEVVRYNPYINPFFFTEQGNIHECRSAVLKQGRVYSNRLA